MRKGLIKISDDLYKDSWNVVSQIFKDFRPIHIEFRFWENDVWYLYGESELFDEVKAGEKVPEYFVVFTEFSNGVVTYEFKKE